MKTITEQTFLVDHFLIAMPQLQDSYFANSVVYIWQHSSEGALGLVVTHLDQLRRGSYHEAHDREPFPGR